MKRYPIQDGPSVPWEVMAPHEAQAAMNHGQSLEQLAQRGGIGCTEAWAIVNGFKWSQVKYVGLAEAKTKWFEFAERWNGAVEAEREAIAKMVEAIVVQYCNSAILAEREASAQLVEEWCKAEGLAPGFVSELLAAIRGRGAGA